MTKVEGPFFIRSRHCIENVNQPVGDEKDAKQQSNDVLKPQNSLKEVAGMLKGTWLDTKGHHWIDVSTQRGKPYMEAAYRNYTTPMTRPQHVQAHRNGKEVGPMGAIARYDRDRIMQGEGFLMF